MKKVSNFFSLVPIRKMRKANMFQEEDITESTVIQKQKRRRPSFWANVGTLLVLVAAILAAQKVSRKWITPDLPEEEIEAGIVLEDLETEKPLAESEAMAVPSVPEPETETPAAAPTPAPAVTPPPPAKKIARPVKKISPYAYDPYTNSGPRDLDRPENWEIYFPDRPKSGVVKTRVPAEPLRREATAAPLLPTERDRFIPFEKE